MAKGKGKKDPFDDLDDEFKESINTGSTAEIRAAVCKAALDQQELMDLKADDQALKEAQAAATAAGAVYAEGTKMNRLRIKYAQQMLRFRGETVPRPDTKDPKEHVVALRSAGVTVSVKVAGEKPPLTFGKEELLPHCEECGGLTPMNPGHQPECSLYTPETHADVLFGESTIDG